MSTIGREGEVRLVALCFVEEAGFADWALAGFEHVPAGKYARVLQAPDDERPGGGRVYRGQLLDGRTLRPAGREYRSACPSDLGRWWRRVTHSTPPRELTTTRRHKP